MLNEDQEVKHSRSHIWTKETRPKSPGRPKGAHDVTEELWKTLRYVEKDKKKTILQHAWERAYVNDKVLVAMLKKISPDLTQETGDKVPTTINLIYGHLKEGQHPVVNRIQVFQKMEGQGE